MEAVGVTSRPAAGRGPTPIRISRRVGYLLALAALVVLVFVVWKAPSVLLVGVGGVALALVLSFPVRFLSRFVPRSVAILASFLILALLAFLGVYVVVPLLVDQLAGLVMSAPRTVVDADRALRGLLVPLAERGLLPGTPDELLDGLVRDLSERARGLAEGILGGLVGFVRGAFGLAIQLLAALVIAAYLLADVRKVEAVYLRAAPHRYRRDARQLWNAFGLSLSRYLSGLAFVAFVQGALSGVALSILGVDYAFLLGAWVAVTAVVPLFGAWIGAIPSVILAFFVNPTVGVVTVIVFLAIQQLEGNVLTPRVMGSALGVHPILVLLAVIGAGQLFGLAGVLLAVPALAVLRVLFDFFRARLYIEG
jgi:predicted PurR-regulated permease PerM